MPTVGVVIKMSSSPSHSDVSVYEGREGVNGEVVSVGWGREWSLKSLDTDY